MNNTQRLTILILASFFLSGCCGVKKPNVTPIHENVVTYSDTSFYEAGNKIYFTFDSAALSKEAKQILIKQGKWLKTNLNATATIEGHCDEIGTKEYNFTLGLKRAQFAKNFLIKQGVDKQRLKIISYGKTKPDNWGHDKYAHRANRRAVTVVIE